MKKLFDIVFSVVCCLVIVFGGFMSGISFGAIYEYNHLTANADVEDYRAYTRDTIYGQDLQGFMSALIGFNTSNSDSLNWSSLTTSSAADGYNYYMHNFYIEMTTMSSSFDIMIYYSGYNNTSEYLALYSGGSARSPIVRNSRNYYPVMNISVEKEVDSNNQHQYNYSEGTVVFSLRSQKATTYSKLACGFLVPTGSSYGYFSNVPTLNWVSYEIGNYTDSENPFASGNFPSYLGGNSSMNTGRYNWIKFTDTTGFSVFFALPVYYTSSNTPTARPMWYYDYNKYYYYNGITTDGSDPYYQQGYNDGLAEGEQTGYSDGYDDGYQQGDAAGYNRGLSDDHYTFINFLGAVVDAPVQAFRGLFNIEILGVNLADFLTGLLTIAVVLMVAKFVFLH